MGYSLLADETRRRIADVGNTCAFSGMPGWCTFARFYSINPDGMRVIELWLERHRRAMAGKLDDLDQYLVEREDRER